MRKKLLIEFKEKQSINQNKAAKVKKQHNCQAIKQSLKWAIGALLVGFLFINIWDNSK